MQFAQFIEHEIIQPDRIAAALRTTKPEIAATLGLGRDAFSRLDRLRAPKTQTRLREMLEILARVIPDTGSLLAAYAWFRAAELPGFGGMTPDQLVRSGHGQFVHAYLNRVRVGGYA